jgi:hypothetical protein
MYYEQHDPMLAIECRVNSMTEFLLKIVTTRGPTFQIVDKIEFDHIVQEHEARGCDVKIIGICENTRMVKLASQHFE